MKNILLSILLSISSIGAFAQATRVGFDRVLFSAGISSINDNEYFNKSLSGNGIYKVASTAFSLELSVPLFYITEEISNNLKGFYEYKAGNSNITIQTYGLEASMDVSIEKTEKYELVVGIGGGYLFHRFDLYNVDKIKDSKIDSSILTNNSHLKLNQSFIAIATLNFYNEYHISDRFSVFGLVKIRWDYGKSNKYQVNNTEISLSPYTIDKLYIGLGVKYRIY